MGIFRQRIGPANSEPLVTNQDDSRSPLLTRDGRWMLYFAWEHSGARSKTGRLMRIPASGGAPELVLQAKAFRVLPKCRIS